MIEGHEHMSMHMQEHMQDPKFVESLTKRMDYAREFANKWHGSQEGIEWHRKHGKEVAKNIKPVKFVCENCGKEFLAKSNGGNRFCSNACKTAWRVKSGKDNIMRKCIICGNEFEVNKYIPKHTCSKECARKYASQIRIGTKLPDIPQKQSFCTKCGKPMMVSGYSKGKMCDECKHNSLMVTSICEICGNEFEHSKYNNARFCSIECVGKYNSQRALERKKKGVTQLELKF